MTTQKLSGLEHARRWMDSLGMRHYGEVDAAIAEAEAGASGYSTTRHTSASLDLPKHCPPPWQEIGFAAYASGALEGQRCTGNDFNRLFDHTDPTADTSCAETEEKFAWNEALRAAKELVNSPSPEVAAVTVDGGVIAKTDLRSDGVTFATLEVRMKPVAGDVQTPIQSIDVTCNTSRSLAIHFWI